MRLTYKNIDSVRRYEIGGITYCWTVVMKSHKPFDLRVYNHMESGVSVVRDYPVTDLPVTVQQFIAQNKHFERVMCSCDEDTPKAFVKYIITRKEDFNNV